MKGQPRTNEEKAYLVLQHLYELATDKDPTGRNPYRMEKEIIEWVEYLAEEVSKDFVDRLYKSSASPEEIERIMTIMKEIKGMGED